MDLSLAILGCGGMARRHLNGLTRLKEIDQNRFELIAVCDLIPEAGQRLAGQAEDLLGRRSH